MLPTTCKLSHQIVLECNMGFVLCNAKMTWETSCVFDAAINFTNIKSCYPQALLIHCTI